MVRAALSPEVQVRRADSEQAASSRVAAVAGVQQLLLAQATMTRIDDSSAGLLVFKLLLPCAVASAGGPQHGVSESGLSSGFPSLELTRFPQLELTWLPAFKLAFEAFH